MAIFYLAEEISQKAFCLVATVAADFVVEVAGVLEKRIEANRALLDVARVALGDAGHAHVVALSFDDGLDRGLVAVQAEDRGLAAVDLQVLDS